MAFALGAQAREAGYKLAAHDSVDSTNATALALARDGESGPLWVVTRRQTAGRGRRGRIWSTGEGNLAASLLLTTNAVPAVAATLGFVAGLALDDALRSCAPGAAIALKWPNDVLCDGKKLAGILLEAEAAPGGLAVVIGIGVNLASAPEGMPFPAASLAARGFIVHPETMFAALTDAWAGFGRLWDGGRGMPRLRDLWVQKAAGLGQAVTVSTGDRVVEGVFETLDNDGRMILRTADNTELPISAGEVHFGGAATRHDPAKGRA